MITIELLDIVYGAGVLENDLYDSSLATTTAGNWAAVGTTGAEYPAPAPISTKYMHPVSALLTDGVEYDLTFTVTNKTGAGSCGFSSLGGTTTNGIGNTARRNSNGTTSITFTAINSSQAGGNAARLFMATGVTATLSNISITPSSSIDFDSSVIGELDISNHNEFPLALTFSISELRDITAKKGTYSKTFKIPATKNNNKIFKYSYSAGAITQTKIAYPTVKPIQSLKNCRILVDDLYSIVGQLQITAIGSSSSPDYYSCVFYGNNIDWTQELKDAALKDLKVKGGAFGSGWDTLNGKTGTGLQLNYSGVSSTWTEDDADTGSPIVYPIQDLGKMNVGANVGLNLLAPEGMTLYQTYAERHSGGVGAKVGYWGFDSNGNSYGNIIPEVDWRPCIWVYDVMKQIFSSVGYTINSTFIESSAFKTLLFSTPNFIYNVPTDRFALQSMQVTFSTWAGASGAFDKNYTGYSTTQTSTNGTNPYWFLETMKFDLNSMMNVNGDYANLYDADVNGFFTIADYGFHTVYFKNFSVGICDITDTGGGASWINVQYLRAVLQVRTAGETHWHTIDEVDILDYVGSRYLYVGTSYAAQSPPGRLNIPQLTADNRWFNKGDTFRFALKGRIKGRYGGSTASLKVKLYSTDGLNVPTGGYASGNCDFSSGLQTSFIQCNLQKSELPCWGQTYDLKTIINAEYSQLDFIKGVAHAFNLQFTTDTVSRVVTIEPFNDFYLNPSTTSNVDWTEKVDRGQNYEDSWIDAGLTKEIIFKYKPDSNDKKLEERGDIYFEGIHDEYPYKEILGDAFPKGVTTFENPFFAGTYNGRSRLLNTRTPSPTLWGENEDGSIPHQFNSARPIKGYNFLPRLLSWAKYECSAVTPLIYSYENWLLVWGTSITQSITNATNVAADFNTWPLAVSYNGRDKSFPIAQSLTYGSVWSMAYDCSAYSVNAITPLKGLYQNYYQEMIESIKDNGRLRVVYIDLKISDIINLDFRKLIYLDGDYWRINKIVDYQPNNNQATKVELVQHFFGKEKLAETKWPYIEGWG
jgi:hypothetical protein